MRGDDGGADEQFAGYVRARGEHLLRVAVLLTGDWHAAEDLVQASLVKPYRSWPRLDTKRGSGRLPAADLVNTHRSWWRARWRRETPTAMQTPSAPSQVTKAAEATARQSYHVRSVTGVKGIGPVALNGEFDPARGVGEETSSTGARVRFADGYRYLPLSDAFRAAYERTRGSRFRPGSPRCG